MSLKDLNKKRWDAMRITEAQGPAFKAVADRLLFQRPRYEAVSKALKSQGYNIPWEFIAVTHQREASGDFTKYLGNGQALNKKTTIVPKGRGPFSSWEQGAIDALVYAPPYAAKNTDWSIGGTLAKLEEYNGLGYSAKGVPSPYIWAGTDQYTKGKYVADHKYDPEHVDTQLGCAGLLKFMGWSRNTGSTAAGVGTVIAAAGTAAVASTPVEYWHWVIPAAVAAVVISIVGVLIYKFNKQVETV